MAIERTLSIIKPDVTERNLTGQILARLEGAGLKVIAQKSASGGGRRRKEILRGAYKGQLLGPRRLHDLRSHRGAGAGGEERYRQEPRGDGRHQSRRSAPGTIRKDFGVNHQKNSVHGSDSPETAKMEIALCFNKAEIVG